MIVYGDELARTQNGNNNPYNLDAVGTWNNYATLASDAPHRVATGASGEAYHDNFGADARADGRSFAFDFARKLIAIRRASESLRQGDYTMPITFAKADGSSGFNANADRAARIHLDGSRAGDADHVLYVNMWSGPVDFQPPTVDAGKHWVRIIDTAAWAEGNGNVWSDDAGATITGTYTAAAWSIVVLKAVGAAPPAPVAVTFRCDGCTTVWGQDVYVAGDAAALGPWNTAAAMKLAPTAYPTWTGTINLPAGATVQYKFIKKAGTAVTWEAGDNRVYTVPASGTGATGGTWR